MLAFGIGQIHLAGSTILPQFRNQIDAEIRLHDWESDKRSLEPRINAFEAAFFSPADSAIKSPLTESQTVSIREESIRRAWTSLFRPRPPNVADEILHNCLQGDARSVTLAFLDSIEHSKKDVEELLREQEELNRLVVELGRKIDKLEGLDRDGTLNALKQRVDDLKILPDRLAESLA